MRFNEFSKTLNEGGRSGQIRYNSEIGTLLALAGNEDAHDFEPSDPKKYFDSSKLANPLKVFKEIKTFLVPNWNEKFFWSFYGIAINTVIPNMKTEFKESKTIFPTSFGWAGGSNKSDDGPADVEFVNHKYSGISIKGAGGITLANLSPKGIGLKAVRGEDIFDTYAKAEYKKWKQAIIKGTMKEATSNANQWYAPNSKRPDDFGIMYSTEDNNFYIWSKGKQLVKTKQELLSSSMMHNEKWHRVFGEHLIYNKSKYASLTKALYLKIAEYFIEAMEEFLGKENQITKLLQYSDKPYFYMSPKKLYVIPKFDDLDELEIKKIMITSMEGAGINFLTSIAHPGSEDSTTIEIHVRYANGVFQANPTVRAQSIKNPQYVYWKDLLN